MGYIDAKDLDRLKNDAPAVGAIVSGIFNTEGMTAVYLAAQSLEFDTLQLLFDTLRKSRHVLLGCGFVPPGEHGAGDPEVNRIDAALDSLCSVQARRATPLPAGTGWEEAIEAAAKIAEDRYRNHGSTLCTERTRHYEHAGRAISEAIRSLSRPAVQETEGWKLVPETATQEMAEGGLDALLANLGHAAAIIRDADACWRAMLAASPLPHGKA